MEDFRIGRASATRIKKPAMKRAMKGQIRMSSVSKQNENGKAPLSHVVREGRVSIGPELAERILADAAFDGQRKSEPHHVELMVHLMRANRWTPGSQIVFCDLGGRLFLTNGKHRMNAVKAAGVPQEFQVLIVKCNSMAEVEADYHRHDTVARKRSVPEILKSTEVGRNAGLPAKMLTSLYSAGLLLDRNLASTHYTTDPLSRDVDARLQSVSNWMREAKSYAAMIANAPARQHGILCGAGVLCVALMTIRYRPELATLFWTGIADDDGLRKGDPRKTLLDDFDTRTNETNIRARMLPAAIAWNAFYESRVLKIIKVLSNSVLRISGTPVDGRK